MTNKPCVVCGEKVDKDDGSGNVNQRNVFCPQHHVEEGMMKQLDQLNDKLNSFIDEFKNFKDITRERICKFEIQEILSKLRVEKS